MLPTEAVKRGRGSRKRVDTEILIGGLLHRGLPGDEKSRPRLRIPTNSSDTPVDTGREGMGYWSAGEEILVAILVADPGVGRSSESQRA